MSAEVGGEWYELVVKVRAGRFALGPEGGTMARRILMATALSVALLLALATPAFADDIIVPP
jgi:hypothetical protein